MSRILGFAAICLLFALPAAAQDCFDYAMGEAPPVLGTIGVGGRGGHVAVVGDLAVVAWYYYYDEQSVAVSVYDAQDPSNLVRLGWLTGFAAAGLSPRSDLQIVGDHVYLNSPSTWCGVDIGEPSAPVLDFAIHGLEPLCFRIAGEYAYLSRTGGLLDIWDLSDPTAPQLLDSLSDFGLIKTMEQVGDYLYLYTDSGLQVASLADPEQPALVNTVTLPGELANKMFLHGERLYYLGFLDSALHSLDVSDPAAPVPTAVGVPPRAGTLSFDSAFAAKGDVLYMSDGAGVRLFDISDPDDPQPIGAFGTNDDQTSSVAVSDAALFSFGRVGNVKTGYLDCNSLTAVPPVVPGASARVSAFPNPFNPRTEIRVELPQAQWTDVSIHDVQGRLLRTLFAGELPAGTAALTWRGEDDQGRPLGSGVYYLRAEGSRDRAGTRLVLLR